MKINLGDKVQDTITGFKGIAVSRTTWISGCDRIGVQPVVDKDGKMPESQTFDEPQLKLIVKKKIEEGSHSKGGPRPNIYQKFNITK